MTFVKSHNGFDIFTFTDTEAGLEQFAVKLDTPDGLISIQSGFTDYPKAVEFIENKK